MLKSVNKTSLLAFFLISICLLVFNFLFLPQNILSWDVFGYYLYLPLTFINNDLKLHDAKPLYDILDLYHNSSTLYQAYETRTGLWVLRYPMGMAVLYSPFFMMGHLVASFTNYAKDGFSLPYQIAILSGGVFYSITGFYFVRKILLYYFTDKTAAITLIILFFGTNYFFHTSFVGTNAMSHNYLFTLYAIIVWLTIQWHKTFRLKTLVVLAVVCGLAILARPSEMVCLFIPFLWRIGSQYDLKEKLILFINTYRYHTLCFLTILLVIGFPQLLYWKIITKKFLYYSYGDNAGEGFEFAHPFVWEVLLSFRKGWLIYTPLMILSLVGLFYIVRSKKEFGFPILIYFLINFYIISSWSCWWYAESFGQRALIQSYAVLALPLGALINNIESRKGIVKKILFSGIVLFIILNLFQTWQYHNGVIHSSRMTKEAYFAVFGKRDTPDDYDKMLLMDRPGGAVTINESEYTKTKEWIEEFDNGGITAGDTAFSGTHSFRMDSLHIYSPVIKKAFKEITDKDHAKLKVSIYVFCKENIKDNPGSLTIAFEHNKYAYGYSATSIDTLTIEPGKWTEVTMNYLTPVIRRPTDQLKVNYWYSGKKELLVDKLKVEVWEPNKSD